MQRNKGEWFNEMVEESHTMGEAMRDAVNRRDLPEVDRILEAWEKLRVEFVQFLEECTPFELACVWHLRSEHLIALATAVCKDKAQLEEWQTRVREALDACG